MLGVTVRWGQVLGTSKKAGNWGGAGGLTWMCVEGATCYFEGKAGQTSSVKPPHLL